MSADDRRDVAGLITYAINLIGKGEGGSARQLLIIARADILGISIESTPRSECLMAEALSDANVQGALDRLTQ